MREWEQRQRAERVRLVIAVVLTIALGRVLEPLPFWHYQAAAFAACLALAVLMRRIWPPPPPPTEWTDQNSPPL
jgi:hypothetical protein